MRINPPTKAITKSNSISGIRAAIGATISILIKESKSVNTQLKAEKGINIPSINLSRHGLEIYFPYSNIAYAKDFYQALQAEGFVNISSTIVIRKAGKKTNALEFKNSKGKTFNEKAKLVKVVINDHIEVGRFVERCCHYANTLGRGAALYDLYIQAKYPLPEIKAELKEIFQIKFPHYTFPDADYETKLIATFHKLRFKFEYLPFINDFFKNIGKFYFGSLEEYKLKHQEIVKAKILEKNLHRKEAKEGSGFLAIVDEDAIKVLVKLSIRYPERNLGFMNPANARTPGGAVMRVRGTLEEAFCRRSSLWLDFIISTHSRPQNHPFINFLDSFEPVTEANYKSHLEEVVCIEQSAKKLPEKDRYEIKRRTAHYAENVLLVKNPDAEVVSDNIALLGVISVAAIDLRSLVPESDRGEYVTLGRLDSKRFTADTEATIRTALDRAKAKKLEILVLCALGCGAFANPPELVAGCFKKVFSEPAYLDYLKTTLIVFAIWKDSISLQAFEQVFSLTRQRDLSFLLTERDSKDQDSKQVRIDKESKSEKIYQRRNSYPLFQPKSNEEKKREAPLLTHSHSTPCLRITNRNSSPCG